MGEVLDVAIYPIKGAQRATIDGVVPTSLEATKAGFRAGDFADRGWLVVAGEGDEPLTVVTPRGWGDDNGPRVAHPGDRLLAGMAADIVDEGTALDLTRTDGATFRLRHDGLLIEEERAKARPVRIHGGTVWGVEVPDAGEFVSDQIGRSARLMRAAPSIRRELRGRVPGDTLAADGYPYLITNQASLDFLNELEGRDIRMSRYRPNITVVTDNPVTGELAVPFAEDTVGLYEIGDKWFRVVSACGRCVVTNLDPTGKVAGGGLRVLRTRQGQKIRGAVPMEGDDEGTFFGVNAVLSGFLGETRMVSVGDHATVLAQTAPHVFLKAS